MTTRRRFDYASFVTGWRALAAAHGLNTKTGQPVECEYVYRVDQAGRRRLDYVPVQPDPEPLALCEPNDPHWWHAPQLFNDPGPAHSVVEREAIANIAAEARALVGQKPPETLAQAMTREFRQIVREVLTEAADDRRHLPLRELHRLRGVTVEEVAGQRMEVPLKVA